MKLVRKDNHDVTIVSTLERLYGACAFSAATRQADGTLDLDYDGYTEIYWDSQHTVHRGGQRVFIDAEGEELLESEVELIDETEVEED